MSSTARCAARPRIRKASRSIGSMGPPRFTSLSRAQAAPEGAHVLLYDLRDTLDHRLCLGVGEVLRHLAADAADLVRERADHGEQLRAGMLTAQPRDEVLVQPRDDDGIGRLHSPCSAIHCATSISTRKLARVSGTMHSNLNC